MEQRRGRWGQIAHSAAALGTLIPVFGQFVAAGDELFDIWVGDPKAEAALRSDIMDRAVALINTFRGDVEARFAAVGDQLTVQLNTLTELAKQGATSAPLAAAFYAVLLNEGLIGGRALPEAEFAARHLTEVDVHVLMHLYDRVDYQHGPRYPDDYHWGRGLPKVTVFEAAYVLDRLQTFGFFCIEPDSVTERVELRGYLPQLDVIGDFAEQAGLVRVVTLSPQAADRVPTDDYIALGQFALSHLILGGGAVRWHLLKGYQWSVKDFWAQGEGGGWHGAFTTAAEAQAAAEEELRRNNMVVNWETVAA